jgi:pimeloyl-ACP methyl ester carboxylesterase
MTRRGPKSVLAVALGLVFAGGILAWRTQTDGGRIAVKDIRFVGNGGQLMSALLYVPKGASAKTPAPGILAVHGYINSRETQDGFAIEFARRGWVVLAIDQTGHGYSDPPAYAAGFGGPDGLRYLRSLDIVDAGNIGLEGHSMGGWAVLAAAKSFPGDYRSVVLAGSSTGSAGAPAGTAAFPRNLAVVFSRFDEFSNLMWGARIARDVVDAPKLKAVFGAAGTIEVGRLYGSIEDGTARKLFMPATTHPGDHLSREAIGNAVEWFQATLQGGNGLPPDDQIWPWKEAGTLLALAGFVLFLFPMGGLLLRTRFFASLAGPVRPPDNKGGIGWAMAALLAAAVPAATYFWAQQTTSRLIKASAIWPQNVTTGIMGWAVLNGVITILLILAGRLASHRGAETVLADCGLAGTDRKVTPAKIGKSFLLAACVAGAGGVLLAVSDGLFKIDFRFWVVALKPMSALQFRIFLGYLPPFLFFFLALGAALHGRLRTPGGAVREMLVNAAVTAGGIAVLLGVQYIPLFAGGTLAVPDQPLLTIVAIPFVPLLVFAASVSSYFFRKTGLIYAGAFLNALVVTWYIVAGQAVHFPLM